MSCRKEKASLKGIFGVTCERPPWVKRRGTPQGTPEGEWGGGRRDGTGVVCGWDGPRRATVENGGWCEKGDGPEREVEDQRSSLSGSLEVGGDKEVRFHGQRRRPRDVVNRL